MITKSLSRKSNPGQLVKYALRYVTKAKGETMAQENTILLVKHNLRTRDVEGYINEFKENESFRIYRRKDSVVLFHTILSFAPGDKKHITKAMLKDVATKFIELRAPQCLNLATAHLEKNHAHIHVVTSGVKTNGYSARVSKQEFKQILNELEQYQQEKYPELVHSKNKHEKIKIEDKERLITHLQMSRQSQKAKILARLNEAFKSAKSQDEFTEKLERFGYNTYLRNGNLQGIVFEGKKFRFSSLGFDKSAVESLQNRFDTFAKSLGELQAIRAKGLKERQMVKEKVGEEKSQTEIVGAESELTEIQLIRKKSKELGGEGRMRDFEGPDIRIDRLNSLYDFETK